MIFLAVAFLALSAFIALLALRQWCAARQAQKGRKQAKTPTRRSNNALKHILAPHQVYANAVERGIVKQSIIKRHELLSCHALVKLDRSCRKQAIPNPIAMPAGAVTRCYGCGKTTDRVHALYVFSCPLCGNTFHKLRALRRNLGNKTALVIGGRTKLGHQVALKLLQAGANVIVTTRFPLQAQAIFAQYDNYKSFACRLHFAPSLDLRPCTTDGTLSGRLKRLVDFVRQASGESGALHILVNCAAQTIACRERQSAEQRSASAQKNRYGDALHVASDEQNSWALRFEDVSEQELRDVHDINAIGIALLVQAMLPLLKQSKSAPYVVNVHAREGLFQTHKSAKHFHTNMAKASLHMLTRMLCEQRLETHSGQEFRIHGVDPGWFSVDEYYENGAPMPCAPLDEIDAAARVCYPIFKQLQSSGRTRRHFDQFAV